jgi:hypothetical protein
MKDCLLGSWPGFYKWVRHDMKKAPASSLHHLISSFHIQHACLEEGWQPIHQWLDRGQAMPLDHWHWGIYEH